jgi:hypothetical protein
VSGEREMACEAGWLVVLKAVDGGNQHLLGAEQREHLFFVYNAYILAIVMRRGPSLVGFMLVVSGQTYVPEISHALGRTPEQDSPYRLTVPVNEVSLTFHVSDSRGSAIDNITG